MGAEMCIRDSNLVELDLAIIAEDGRTGVIGTAVVQLLE